MSRVVAWHGFGQTASRLPKSKVTDASQKGDGQ